MIRPKGTQNITIPIEDILKEFEVYADEIVNGVAGVLVKTVRKNIRKAVKRDTGRLLKSVKKKKSIYSPNNVLVKVADSKAHLLEFGHDVKVAKDGAVVGHAPAHPFMRPAEEEVAARLHEIVAKIVPAPSVEVKK